MAELCSAPIIVTRGAFVLRHAVAQAIGLREIEQCVGVVFLGRARPFGNSGLPVAAAPRVDPRLDVRQRRAGGGKQCHSRHKSNRPATRHRHATPIATIAAHNLAAIISHSEHRVSKPGVSGTDPDARKPAPGLSSINRKLGVICDPRHTKRRTTMDSSGQTLGGIALRVLALASQKGGAGKTTLSGHLAVQAQRAGAGPVVLIDIDPQGSLADWWNEREAEYPAFAHTTVARRAGDPATLRQQGFKLAVIDTPPAITMAIQSVIGVAELILVPTRPSPHDLRAVGATVDLCERAGKPLIFVVNAATPKAKITYEAAVALSQHGTVAPVTLHHRTDYAASMIDGRTVMEIDPNGRSAKEVAELWDYISDRLEKNFRRTVFAAPGAAPGSAPASPRPVGGFGRRVVGQ